MGNRANNPSLGGEWPQDIHDPFLGTIMDTWYGLSEEGQDGARDSGLTDRVPGGLGPRGRVTHPEKSQRQPWRREMKIQPEELVPVVAQQ